MRNMNRGITFTVGKKTIMEKINKENRREGFEDRE
jgi:hypothetical protein